MTAANRATRQVTMYRTFLVLYPRAFRRDYGDPMAQLFADRVRDHGARAWLRVAPDLARSVPQQRIEALMSDLSPGARVLGITVLVLLSAVAVLGFGGLGVVLPIAVALTILVATQRRFFTSIFGSDRVRVHRAVVQAWWAPAAALIALGEIALGVDNVFNATNWGGHVFGSSVPIAIGAGMLFGLARRPFARAAGNSLVLIATIPALLFFWAILPPLLGIVVWIGVLSSGFETKTAIASRAS